MTFSEHLRASRKTVCPAIIEYRTTDARVVDAVRLLDPAADEIERLSNAFEVVRSYADKMAVSLNTKAKAEIWTESDKFKAAAAKMQEEMAKLNVAAKAGNLDAIKVAVGETGKQCKGCHDTYRKE